MSPTQKESVEKYVDCVNEYLIVMGEQTFYDGFCLGVQMMMEAINGANQR